MFGQPRRGSSAVHGSMFGILSRRERLRRRFAVGMATLAAVLVAVGAHAQTPTVEGYVREVLERNPSLHARALRRDALEHEASAAGRWPDPVATIMVDRLPEQRTQLMPMLQYQITQTLPWPGKLGLMREGVRQQRAAAQADADVRRLDLAYEAKRAYFMLYLNAQRRAINLANRNLATTIVAAALGRYGAGVGTHHDVARAEVEVAALDREVLNLEGERLSAVAMLNALRDRPSQTQVMDPAEPRPSVADLSLRVLEARALERRPELRGARAMEREAQAMASLARREVYPDGGALPIAGVGRQRERAAAADTRASSAVADAAAMRAMIRFEVADAVARVQTATRQLELIERVVLPKTRESFQASLAGYGSGAIDVLGVLDARRALQATELARADAVAMNAVAVAALERATGVAVEGGTP